MLEAEQYPIQIKNKKKEPLDYHTENILQLARSKEFLQEKVNLYGEKSQVAIKELSNLEKEKGSSLGAHLGNQQSSGRTLHHKYNIQIKE